MHETLATMMTSRRSKSDRVADSRMRSISSLIVASFSMYESVVGNVGLGLVVVVVADEVLDGVLGEEAAELLIELGGERLVVGHHQRRAVHPGDALRHGERLARSR